MCNIVRRVEYVLQLAWHGQTLHAQKVIIVLQGLSIRHNIRVCLVHIQEPRTSRVWMHGMWLLLSCCKLIKFSSICPEGFACGYATGVILNPPLNCAVGHYCPAGTASATQFACPNGTYTNRTDLSSASQCTDCPAGSYCSGGMSAPDAACAAGYYCPINTDYATKFPCPAGTHGNGQVE